MLVVNDWGTGGSLGPAIDEWALEAWERMSDSGLSLHFLADCHRWRGELLIGEKRHWCNDWDGLPMDETCEHEFPCACYPLERYAGGKVVYHARS